MEEISFYSQFVVVLVAAWQVVRLLISLAGGWLFFSPGLAAGEPLAVGVVGIGLLGFAVFAILGREAGEQ